MAARSARARVLQRVGGFVQPQDSRKGMRFISGVTHATLHDDGYGQAASSCC